MPLIAITLVILSALIHAGWNFVSKRETPTTSFIMLANLTGVVVLFPVFVFHYSILYNFPAYIWLLAFFTGFFMASYHTSLAGAYRNGDMSVAYPLARSSPIIVVIVVTFLLGEGKSVSNLCILGIVLILLGCFILPLKNRNEFSIKHYLNWTCLLALLAAFGTAGYSIIDDTALEILKNTLVREDIVAITLLYAFIENISLFLWFSCFVLFSKKEHERFFTVLKNSKKNAMITGIGIVLSYSLVLIAMTYAKNISYIVAFRQLSIPVGAILGMILLKEPAHTPRIVGTIILFVGTCPCGNWMKEG